MLILDGVGTTRAVVAYHRGGALHRRPYRGQPFNRGQRGAHNGPEQLGDQHGDDHDYDHGDDHGGAHSPRHLPGPRPPPVASLPDSRELHFACNTTVGAGIYRINQQEFVFVGLRMVQFADSEHLVGWCTDPRCPQAALHAADVLSHSNFPHHTRAAFFQELPHLCEWAAHVEQAWDGWDSALMQQLRAPHSHTASPFKTSFMHANRQAWAVMPDSHCFSSWSVLLQHSNGTGWFCSSCDRSHTCRHMLASGLTGGNPHGTLARGDFERKLKDDFDLHTGMHHTLQVYAPDLLQQLMHSTCCR